MKRPLKADLICLAPREEFRFCACLSRCNSPLSKSNYMQCFFVFAYMYNPAVRQCLRAIRSSNRLTISSSIGAVSWHWRILTTPRTDKNWSCYAVFHDWYLGISLLSVLFNQQGESVSTGSHTSDALRWFIYFVLICNEIATFIRRIRSTTLLTSLLN